MTNYNDPVGTGLPVRTTSLATPVFSMFSILAIVCALLALFVVGGGLGFFLAIGAIIFGLLGMLEAVLPSRRGGIVSFFAVGAGLLGIVVALIRLVGHSSGNTPGY